MKPQLFLGHFLLLPSGSETCQSYVTEDCLVSQQNNLYYGGS